MITSNAERDFSQRVISQLRRDFKKEIQERPADWQSFEDRINNYSGKLHALIHPLYGRKAEFSIHYYRLINKITSIWWQRPEELKTLDEIRQKDPAWFLSNREIGGVCYVDLFAGSLEKLREKIPYFEELGLTYLHLMPLFRRPDGENDGGYAISSYRKVDPGLGTTEQLTDLATELRHHGISLVLDFVFNHTSDEHEWALKARAGEKKYRDYYFIFPDRGRPDAYETTLREIFPDEHPGAFTHLKDQDEWVWTTFHSYQWDLNYGNLDVFVSMAEEMLLIANLGVEALRLDAVAFIWKELGTGCENLPEAHTLIRAFNLIARIAAPAMVFKSEAIVHPDDVVKYIAPEECQLSYNPLLMALLWEALATREVRLLEHSMRRRFKIDDACSWVNYVRCHDDIGWTFSDDDADQLWMNGYNHRRFLNDFYTNRFLGSFARGLPFQENPKTGDCRISGTCASLAGLEKAEKEETSIEVDLAVKRILLMYAVCMTIGGIPLIYLGDEIATRNDYAYQKDPKKAGDSRWVHRTRFDWTRARKRNNSKTPEGMVFQGLKKLIRLRKENNVFNGHDTEILPTGNPHVFGYIRRNANDNVFVYANFSEGQQGIRLPDDGRLTDLAVGCEIPGPDFNLEPYQFLCLRVKPFPS
ncbi:MAG: amylosucrase [Anaerolineaceae bacterium]